MCGVFESAGNCPQQRSGGGTGAGFPSATAVRGNPDDLAMVFQCKSMRVLGPTGKTIEEKFVVELKFFTQIIKDIEQLLIGVPFQHLVVRAIGWE